VQVFAQQTATAVNQMKDVLITAYSSCFGLQFKILRDFPNTVKALLTSITEIDKELFHPKSLLYF
jgi:hypothetical protein